MPFFSSIIVGFGFPWLMSRVEPPLNLEWFMIHVYVLVGLVLILMSALLVYVPKFISWGGQKNMVVVHRTHGLTLYQGPGKLSISSGLLSLF